MRYTELRATQRRNGATGFACHMGIWWKWTQLSRFFSVLFPSSCSLSHPPR